MSLASVPTYPRRCTEETPGSPSRRVPGFVHNLFGINRLGMAAAALTVSLSVGCRAAISPWGPTFEAAKRSADSVFAGFQYRFTSVRRDPKFAAARPRLGRYALAPARLLRDTSLWTSANAADSSVMLSLFASWESGRYTFAAAPAPDYPKRLAEQRHLIRLRRVQGDDYEWVTIVDHAIGPAKVSEVGAALGALLTGFEGRRDTAVVSDARANFGRTARVLGRLMALDSLRTAPSADGATTLTLAASARPDSLRRGFPAFAAYLTKYVMPSILRLRVTDRAGNRYIELDLTGGKLLARLRARDRQLVALVGPPRPMPDSLKLRLDFSAKFMIFRVGFSNLEGDFVVDRDTHERAWHMAFRREPDWHFPLAVNHLIRTPLRTPFAGRGAELHFSVRDDLGPQTMSIRRGRLVVNESAIMRWLGGLGATAFADFEGTSEAEENRFLAALFEAMRADVRAMAAP